MVKIRLSIHLNMVSMKHPPGQPPSVDPPLLSAVPSWPLPAGTVSHAGSSDSKSGIKTAHKLAEILDGHDVIEKDVAKIGNNLVKLHAQTQLVIVPADILHITSNDLLPFHV